MLKFYSKDVLTTPDGSMRIIGNENTPFYVLKDKDGPLFAGTLSDCEYIAQLTKIDMNYRTAPLYLSRFFTPCHEEVAVRSVVPYFREWTYVVKYAAPTGSKGSFANALREVFLKYSPYEVTKFLADGERTTDRYINMMVTDLRTHRAMVISFVRGIKVTYAGDDVHALYHIGGKAVTKWTPDPKEYRPWEDDMSENPNWCWDIHGKSEFNATISWDPDCLTKLVRRFDTAGEVSVRGHAKEICVIARNSANPAETINKYKLEAQEAYTNNGLEAPASIEEAFALMLEWTLASLTKEEEK